MIQKFFKAVTVVACFGLLGAQALAQPEKEKEKIEKEKIEKEKIEELIEDERNENGKFDNDDEIVIKKKVNKDVKVTIEIKDGLVKVNGKPLADFDDGDVVVRKRREDMPYYGLRANPSPFRSGTWNFNDDMKMEFGDSKRGFLGVVSERVENGAKITRITEGSAAAKAGLKEGDVITRVEETKIETPEDLSKTIAKIKPEGKATITFKRENKEQKVTATLGKRPGGPGQIFTGPENFKDFNFDFAPGFDGPNFFHGGSPRLGIKAQDTEDGKGVKVLDVDDESNAAKAGIKEGDILTQFDGKNVNSATELAEAAKAAKDKSSIRIKLSRDGKSQEVEVKVPKKLKTANL